MEWFKRRKGKCFDHNLKNKKIANMYAEGSQWYCGYCDTNDNNSLNGDKITWKVGVNSNKIV